MANLPEDMTVEELKDLFIERGFTVKEAVECGNGGQVLSYRAVMCHYNVKVSNTKSLI